MIKLVFKCDKCKAKKEIVNPSRDQDQPFCDKCYLPMFIDRAKVKND